MTNTSLPSDSSQNDNTTETLLDKNLSPPKFTQTYQQALEHLQNNQLKEAEVLTSSLLANYPQHANAWGLTAKIALASKRYQLSLKSALKAFSLERNNPEYMVQIGQAYLALGHKNNALLAAQKAEALEPTHASLWDAIGSLFHHCRNYHCSARCRQQAVNIEPDNAHLIYNMATSYQSLGDLEKAKVTYEQAVTINPDDYDAHISLARLSKQTCDSNHIDRLTKLDKKLKQTTQTDWNAQVKIGFAIAKELEDMGNHDESFQTLQQAAKLKRCHSDYDLDKDIAAIDSMIQLFNKDYLGELRPNTRNKDTSTEEKQTPLFIVGMPRSGTTLVEQILSSHRRVTAGGEFKEFGQISGQLASHHAQKAGINTTFSESLAAISMEVLGKEYLSAVQYHVKNAQYFTDKMPLNSLYAAAILQALPNARIIAVQRHPIDLCYSNYKVAFHNGNLFSYDLDELAQYYIAHQRLIEHWQSTLPTDRFYTLNYEHLVNHQEEETQKLLNFCGLPFEQECLHYYNNPSPVVTASSIQVRQPLYRTSIGSWQNYKKQLQPLIQRLREAGIET